jgi:hypothetical protein
MDELVRTVVAVLAGNAITALAIYIVIAYRRGDRVGVAFVNAVAKITHLGWRAVQLYIAIMFLGAFAYAAKLLLFGG